MRRVMFVALGCLASLGIATQAMAGQLDAYAPPLVWGSSTYLPATLGAVTLAISYEAVGKTKVVGEVTYVDDKGNFVSREFVGSITIRTGNYVHTPSLRFKGEPFGSVVKVRY